MFLCKLPGAAVAGLLMVPLPTVLVVAVRAVTLGCLSPQCCFLTQFTYNRVSVGLAQQQQAPMGPMALQAMCLSRHQPMLMT
jgi:hypothetical protein